MTLKLDNTAVDRRVIEAVKNGCTRFQSISNYVAADSSRQVDRRLQALRKKGVLKFSSKDGWRAQ